MRPRKRRNTWLAILDAQGGPNDRQMNENVLTVCTRKTWRQDPQSHIGQSRFENNFSHLQGNPGQTSVFEVIKLPQPLYQQVRTHLIRTKSQGPHFWNLRHESKNRTRLLGGWSNFAVNLFIRREPGASSAIDAESSTMCPESLRPFHSHAVGDANSNKMELSSQTENGLFSNSLHYRPIVEKNERDVGIYFENTFQNGILHSCRTEGNISTKLHLVQRPISPLSKATNFPVIRMQMDFIPSDLESKSKSASKSVRKSNSDIKQYMKGKFLSFRADLNTMRSGLDFVKSTKFEKRGNCVVHW